MTSGTSGTGANAGSTTTVLSGRLAAPSALTAGYATRGFNTYYHSNSVAASYNFGKPSGHSARIYSASWGSTVVGVTLRCVLGRMSVVIPVPSTLAARGYGWEWSFASRTLSIIAHNGSTLTTTAVTFNPSAYMCYEITALSDGAGTISLFVDGTLLGTSSGGPTTNTAVSQMWWQTEIQNEVTAVSQLDYHIQNPKVYTTNG
jgi:hypothetical protein